MGVRAVQADRHVAGHLVGASHEGEPVAAVQVAVVLDMVELGLPDHLDAVQTAGRDECGWFPVRIGEMGIDDEPALRVGLVRPVAQGGLHASAYLGLAQPVGTPRHDRSLETPEDHVPHEVLPVLLAHVDDAVTTLGDARGAGEVLRVREECAPLRLE